MVGKPLTRGITVLDVALTRPRGYRKPKSVFNGKEGCVRVCAYAHLCECVCTWWRLCASDVFVSGRSESVVAKRLLWLLSTDNVLSQRMISSMISGNVKRHR